MTARQRAHVRSFDQVSDPVWVPQIMLIVNEDDALALANGRVPESVLQMARASIDWNFSLAHQAAKPRGA